MSILSRPGLPRSPLVEWWKIMSMGVLLAALVYVVFFYQPQPTGQLGTGPPIVRARVAVPEIDRALLSQVKDATHQDRLVLEPEPLAHLLETSIHVVPSVAEALGMPKDPVPISILRATPDTYRGAYLWYRGELMQVSTGRSGHPVEGYRIYEGWIQTPDGETVMFRTSLPPQERVGEFVRVEGFFLKLRDSATMPKADQAPLLIGPELFPDYRPWPPVAELDPKVFAGIRDGVVEGGEFVDLQQATDDLQESQSDPLWTLASYAMHRAGGPEDDLAHWRAVPAFVSKEQLDRVKFGQVPAGTPFRLLGTFVMGEWFAARPNPIGVEYWTKAWIQVRDLGGKTVPVWVPKKLENMKFNASLEVRAYYFRRFVYDLKAREAQAFTPLFVAADLTRFDAGPEHPMTAWAKYVFAGVVAFVIGLFFFMARRDRLARDEHERHLIDRRRRRRERTGPAIAEPPSSEPSA